MTAPSRETATGRRFLVDPTPTDGWDTERWLAVIVLAALALLILIRMGFRGINVMGVSATVS